MDLSRVAFYQVKAKSSGRWTLGPIIRPKGVSKKEGQSSLLSSFLGKMYTDVLKFEPFAQEPTFVSNAQMGFGPISAEVRQFEGGEKRATAGMRDEEFVFKALNTLKDKVESSKALFLGISR